MFIAINPGTGPIEDSTEANARAAIDLFAADLAGKGTPATGITRDPAGDSDGYYRFTLEVGGRHVPVDMPGCDPDLTRAGEPWESPRLFVDGSSWLWEYALDACGPDGN